MNAKKGNKANISLKKNGMIQFEPRENAKIFEKFYSKLATNLVKKWSIAPNILNKGTTKDWSVSMWQLETQLFAFSYIWLACIFEASYSTLVTSVSKKWSIDQSELEK